MLVCCVLLMQTVYLWQMCDRMISPLKMLQRVKHMKEDFEEEGRIQLHEFLDLILWFATNFCMICLVSMCALCKYYHNSCCIHISKYSYLYVRTPGVLM